MSYEIRLRGRIGPALQEVAREEITRTIQVHDAMRTGGVTEAAHEIRKRIKKLRALLVLLREPLGRKRYRDEDTALQKVGRALSRKRDAEALVGTLKQLQQRFFPGRSSPLVRAAHGVFAAQERNCLAHLVRSNSIAASVASLKALLATLGGWPVAKYGWKELRRAVRRSYGRARESHRKAQDSPTAARLHRWRKRAKELWFHLRLLRRASPAFMEELAEDFEVLGEFLGDNHDLLVLKNSLEKRRATLRHGPAMKTLFKLIDLRREELLAAAFDLGERLHEDSPSDFARELDERRATRHKRRRKAKKLGDQLASAK